MLFYSHSITPRLRYITGFMGKEISGGAWQLTSDVQLFKEFTAAKINYSTTAIGPDEYWIQPHSLLFEQDIKLQTIDCFDTDKNNAFFKTSGNFSFDIFAAAFYLLSRYEEYLPHPKDMYGRYAHENSLAFRKGFLQQPLINSWLKNFKASLKQKFSGLILPHSSFTFIPTYDIDEAWSYKHKEWKRTAGGIFKSFLKGNWQMMSERVQVIKNKKPDPFDAYDWMDNLHKEYNLSPRYFFLVTDKTGKYDKNILPTQKAMQELIRHHSNKYSIGVHPSWQSGDDTSLIKKEIKTIEQITGSTVTSSRQHFIRFTLPDTYRQLTDAGIKEDFSMGYGSINGFRASVASPFYWYDLKEEKTTELLISPFCYMEANSFFEQHFSPQQALDEMRYYFEQIKSVNGTYISIWHNTFLGTSNLYAGWREVYKQFIQEVMV